ncbi:helix-hairpin-helix domain-containing protein [Halobellus sp. Atlit-38R]|nr:helix-hairpin-helix domain-containing protein [Halobellus sp. Atlit-38R]
MHFVGPKTAALLRDSEISLTDFLEKRIAYRDLTTAGVNPGVAAKIRREHSLSWSLDGGGTDLDRRSSQVRGLDDDERAWIAASSGWSEDEAETDGSGDGTAGEAAWREQTASGDGTVGRTTDRGVDDGSSATDGEAAWRAGGSDDLLEPEDGGSETGSNERTTATRDAESAWRQQSAPTPLTAVDGLDEEAAATLHRAGIGSVRRLTTADIESVADALDVDRERVASWYRLAREHES